MNVCQYKWLARCCPARCIATASSLSPKRIAHVVTLYSMSAPGPGGICFLSPSSLKSANSSILHVFLPTVLFGVFSFSSWTNTYGDSLSKMTRPLAKPTKGKQYLKWAHWEAVRRDLYRLLIVEKKTVRDVAKLMAENHGFHEKWVDSASYFTLPPSKLSWFFQADYEPRINNYGYHLQQWGFCRNLGDDLLLSLLGTVLDRTEEGRPSAVIISGIQWPLEKVLERAARHMSHGRNSRHKSIQDKSIQDLVVKIRHHVHNMSIARNQILAQKRLGMDLHIAVGNQ